MRLTLNFGKITKYFEILFNQFCIQLNRHSKTFKTNNHQIQIKNMNVLNPKNIKNITHTSPFCGNHSNEFIQCIFIKK